MKIFNGSIKLLVFCLAFGCLFTSCEEDMFPATQDDTALFEVGGAVPVLLNSSPGFFDLGDTANAGNTFNTVIAGETASTGEITISYSGAQGAAGPVSLGMVSIPGDASMTLAEATSALGLDINEVAVGDAFNVVLSANTSSGDYSSVTQTLTASCFSELDGTYDAVSTVISTGAGIGWDEEAGKTWTGQIRLGSDGAGNYDAYTVVDAETEWKDVSMGAYIAAYGTADQGSFPEGDVAWNDVCNKMSYVGASQWGEVYSFTKLAVDGANITIGWANDYGEAGETVLTRTDGTEWPPLVY